MKIALGADSYGFDLKESIKVYLLSHYDHEIEDLGINGNDEETPYYQTARKVAKLVGSQQVDRGILCCGTGMGMAIIANKCPGVYAAVCENIHAAKTARSINNANVLTLGGMFTTATLAQEIVETWLNTEFTQDWDHGIQAWLNNSLKDIAKLEREQFGKHR